eukprot:TRINITY_DN66145_c5_g7_i1.p1 TRINITY_DN66145_c5_g7~~TRINITY_DN66145_c5_g7_i1.p1  ORF type:complete len:1184 (+),score=546.37 TRINITY_DN66145_c5_g7_i1:339-3554(+)
MTKPALQRLVTDASSAATMSHVRDLMNQKLQSFSMVSVQRNRQERPRVALNSPQLSSRPPLKSSAVRARNNSRSSRKLQFLRPQHLQRWSTRDSGDGHAKIGSVIRQSEQRMRQMMSRPERFPGDMSISRSARDGGSQPLGDTHNGSLRSHDSRASSGNPKEMLEQLKHDLKERVIDKKKKHQHTHRDSSLSNSSDDADALDRDSSAAVSSAAESSSQSLLSPQHNNDDVLAAVVPRASATTNGSAPRPPAHRLSVPGQVVVMGDVENMDEHKEAARASSPSSVVEVGEFEDVCVDPIDAPGDRLDVTPESKQQDDSLAPRDSRLVHHDSGATMISNASSVNATTVRLDSSTSASHFVQRVQSKSRSKKKKAVRKHVSMNQGSAAALAKVWRDPSMVHRVDPTSAPTTTKPPPTTAGPVVTITAAQRATNADSSSEPPVPSESQPVHAPAAPAHSAATSSGNHQAMTKPVERVVTARRLNASNFERLQSFVLPDDVTTILHRWTLTFHQHPSLERAYRADVFRHLRESNRRGIIGISVLVVVLALYDALYTMDSFSGRRFALSVATHAVCLVVSLLLIGFAVGRCGSHNRRHHRHHRRRHHHHHRRHDSGSRHDGDDRGTLDERPSVSQQPSMLQASGPMWGGWVWNYESMQLFTTLFLISIGVLQMQVFSEARTLQGVSGVAVVLMLTAVTTVLFGLRFVFVSIVQICLLLSFCVSGVSRGQGFPLVVFFLAAGIVMYMDAAYKSEFYFRRDYIRQRKSAEEERRSRHLLDNMLPAVVLTELLLDVDHIAHSCPRASVLFTDIVNFTNMAFRVSPEDLVALMNIIFSTYDRLSTHHHVYKVETIGDAYLACSGIVEKDRVNPTADLLNFAVDVQQVTRSFFSSDNQPITVRVGIHTGYVVAGVVGIKMPRYHLFGETVTIAESYEEHGVPGRIVVSQATKDAAGPDFLFRKLEPFARTMPSGESKSFDRYELMQRRVRRVVRRRHRLAHHSSVPASQQVAEAVDPLAPTKKRRSSLPRGSSVVRQQSSSSSQALGGDEFCAVRPQNTISRLVAAAHGDASDANTSDNNHA